ncbi:MAG: GTPase Era [Hyphomicrobiaceae bacterium]
MTLKSVTRCGFVAILGAPNAGKSTLVNRLTGAKVSIVSHKAQTTRRPVRGIAAVGASQLVFVDTPGIFSPRRRLDRAMIAAAWRGAAEADLIVPIVDAAKSRGEETDRLIADLSPIAVPKCVVLNKVDRVPDKAALLPVAADLAAKLADAPIFMVSALTGDGIDALQNYLAETVPEGPWHYPADEISDLPERIFAAEATREKIYNRLHDELPYAATVETTAWQDRKDGSVRIEQTIYVERDSQKKIVLGKGGAAVRQISMDARAELADILKRPVHLFLFVKVRPRWAEDPERYREIGLEFPKD